MSKTTHFKLVSLDETHCWDNGIVARAGRVFGVYLFDANRQVNCCEITPSYELHPVADYPLIDLDRTDDRALEDELREAGPSDIIYIHCNNLDRMRAECFHDFGEEEIPSDETWEDALERQLDYARSNVCLEIPNDLGGPYMETPEMVSPAVKSYLETGLFSTTNEDGLPYRESHTADSFQKDSIASATEDVKLMLVAAQSLFIDHPAAKLIWPTPEALGEDFWLTRNRHGAGFWDKVCGGHPAQEFGRKMTEFAHTCGSIDIIEQGDGTLALS